MVITNRTATGKGITQPEIMVETDSVRGIRQMGCAFIRGNHEIRIFIVIDHQTGRPDDLASHPVID